ncbi:Uncharacterised protein [Chlamydia trachomatis]|nr:Uncharacterised protein [Chlamydia trachomatis]
MNALLNNGQNPLFSLLNWNTIQLATIAEAEAHSIVVHILFASNQSERHLRLRSITNLLAKAIVGAVHFATNHILFQIANKLLQVRSKLVCNRNASHLNRSQPCWERAGIMLKQNREETLNRAEECAVNHNWALVATISCNILQLKALRQIEVKLNSRNLPSAADCIASLHRNLRAVECSSTWIVHEFQTRLFSNLCQSVSCFFPNLVGTNELVLILSGKLQIEVVQTEVFKKTKHKVKQAL